MPSAPNSKPSSPRPLRALAVLLALAPACAGRAPTESTPPAAAAPAPAAAKEGDETEARLALLAERLEQARVEHHIPGMAVAVVKGDEIIFARGFGLADIGSERAATPDTVFAIGSTTKAFTSTLVAMQVDAGAMAWDDPVTKYVPEMKLKVRAPQADGDTPQPTLRDVLCHRTGFTRMSLLWASGALPPAGVLAEASNAEPWADFRKTFLYNNVTYASAGEAAARSADTSWSDMMQQRILEPLGMGDTTTSITKIEDGAAATGYRWRTESERHEALPMRNLDSIGPAGSVNSTANDMARWIRLQLGRGTYEGEALVSKARIEETWSPQIDIGSGLKYGMGWMIGDWQGHRMVEHGGNIDGFAAEVGMLPDDDLGFVLLTNVSATPLQRASLGIVFDSLLGELPGDGDEGSDGGKAIDLEPYTGKYVADFGPFDDQRFTVTAEGGTLFIDVPGQTKYELKAPDAEGRWAFAITDTIKVSFDRIGDEAKVLHMLQGGLDLELPREGYEPPPEVSLEEVGELLGRYEEPGKIGVTVEVEHGRLVADIDKQMAFALRKPGEDGRWHFRAKDDLAVSFRRDAKGKVDALIIHESGQDQPLPRVKGKVAPLPTVEQLLARSKAKAFDARFEKLGVLEVTGKVRMPSSGIEGRFRMVFDPQGRRRFEADFGKYGRSVDTFDGEEAWSVSTLGPPTQAEGKFLEQVRVLGPTYLGDWTERFDDVRVEGWATRGDQRLVELVLRSGELPPQRVFVDPKTGHVMAFDQITLAEGMGAIPTKGELRDYRRDAGLVLPHTMVTSTVHSGETILEVEQAKAIEGDPAKLFARAEL